MTYAADVRRSLPVLDVPAIAESAAAGGCGPGGCGCGTATRTSTSATTTATTTASTTTRTPDANTKQETDMTVPTASQPHTQSYSVVGMTCGHCVSSVTEELQELPGVGDVTVDLVAGGTSTVIVTSDQPLDDGAVQGAVEEAGYQLA